MNLQHTPAVLNAPDYRAEPAKKILKNKKSVETNRL
jgi:hypothetical protein